MSKSSAHQSTNLYRVVLVLLSLLIGVSVCHAQSITWQVLPFPTDGTWPGPFGQPAVVTSNNEVILQGQPVRSVQVYTVPATINCDVVLDARTTTDGGLWLFLIPTGQSIQAINFTNAVFFDLGYSNVGQDSLSFYQKNGLAPSTVLWSTPNPLIGGATNHVALGVAANGQLSLSVNGQPYSLPSTTAISFSQFQIELEGWQPGDTWQVLNFTLTTPPTCPNIIGTWTGQVNVAVAPSGSFHATTLSLQVTGQSTNGCLLAGYLNTGNVSGKTPWGCFNPGSLWGNVPFTGTILDTTGVILNFGIFGQASATLDMSQTPPVMNKFILLSTGGAANGDTAVGDLTQRPSGP
jgi:hypothetical protein